MSTDTAVTLPEQGETTETVAVEKKSTKKAPKSKYVGMHYYELVEEANKPIADRRELPIGRGGEKSVMRRYHLLTGEAAKASNRPDEVKAMRELHAAGDKFPNPHNHGNYHFILEALKSLGLNRKHAFKDFMKEIKRLMSVAELKDAEGVTAWERFADKPSRAKQGLPVEGRIMQNIEVLQRITGLNAYGLTINEIGQRVLGGHGACIDILQADEKSPIYVRLNTRPESFLRVSTKSGKTYRIALPINETKSARLRLNDSIKVVTAKANLEIGQWTDDTSMALCLAESLIECGDFSSMDQMTCYHDWWRKGHMSSNGVCFDIGTTVRTALSKFEAVKDENIFEAYYGSIAPSAAGNGSIMRLAPIPMFYTDAEEMLRYAMDSSRTTHGAATCID